MGFITFPSRRAMLLATIVLCVLGLQKLSSEFRISCNNGETQALRKSLCDEYKKHQVFGNLCSSICDGSVKFLDCVPLHASKRLVTNVEFNDKLYVMKAQDIVIESLFNSPEDYPKWDEFPHIVRQFLSANFGKSNYQHIWSLWTMAPDNFNEIKASISNTTEQRKAYTKFLDNFWTLLQNEEYVLSVLFKDQMVFPRIQGTCGSWYMVEYIKPFNVPWGNYIYKGTNSHKTQLMQALKVLEFIGKISPLGLHLCDIKYDHFGETKSNEVQFLDADAVFHENYFRTGILNVSCRSHEDCAFFDCKSACNPKTRKCLPKVSNNNLQRVCETLFQGRSGRNSILPPGLLSKSNSDLVKMVGQCANPSKSHNSAVRDKAPDSIKSKLETLIHHEYNLQ